MTSSPGSSDALESLRRAASGGENGIAQALNDFRPRLKRMVELRMDARLQPRLDASDVIQEVFVEAVGRMPAYLAEPAMPPFLWLRFLTNQKLVALQRMHLGAQARDVRRELSPGPELSTVALSRALVDEATSPSAAAAREELRSRVVSSLEAMPAADREILSLRLIEGLTNAEVSQALGLETSAASKRYVRALDRLRGVLRALDVARDGELP